MRDDSTTRPTWRVPTYWTPEQAESVFLFLHQVLDSIWDIYGSLIIESAEQELQTIDAADPIEYDDDPVPF